MEDFPEGQYIIFDICNIDNIEFDHTIKNEIKKKVNLIESKSSFIIQDKNQNIYVHSLFINYSGFYVVVDNKYIEINDNITCLKIEKIPTINKKKIATVLNIKQSFIPWLSANTNVSNILKYGFECEVILMSMFLNNRKMENLENLEEWVVEIDYEVPLIEIFNSSIQVIDVIPREDNNKIKLLVRASKNIIKELYNEYVLSSYKTKKKYDNLI